MTKISVTQFNLVVIRSSDSLATSMSGRRAVGLPLGQSVSQSACPNTGTRLIKYGALDLITEVPVSRAPPCPHTRTQRKLYATLPGRHSSSMGKLDINITMTGTFIANVFCCQSIES